MKTSIFFSCLVLTALLTGQAFAQHCNSYFPLKQGAAYRIDHFSAKDKKTSSTSYLMKSVKTSGKKTEALIATESVNDKNEKNLSSEMIVICEGDKLLMDMRSMMPQSQTEAYKNMEMKADASYLELPATLSAGQKLPDGEMKMEFVDKKSGKTAMTMTIKIMNRVVEGKETLTTSAGTFDCFKIKYDGSMGNQMEGVPFAMPKFNYGVTEYICPGTGMVKSITTNKNGKMMGYSLLAKSDK